MKVKIYSFVYRKWLKDYRVVKVRGWRTALCEHKKWKTRETITPCFLWFD